MYISQKDAVHWSQSPRLAPILGVADGEVDLAALIAERSPLDNLRTAYALTSFDLDVILIALAPEVDVRYERLYAFLQDDVSRRAPSLDLALNLLSASAEEKLTRRDRFASNAPLVRNELIELVPDSSSALPSFPSHVLHLDGAVARYVLCQGGIDPTAATLVASYSRHAHHGDDLTELADTGALESTVVDAQLEGEKLRPLDLFGAEHTREARPCRMRSPRGQARRLLAADVSTPSPATTTSSDP